MTAFPPPILNQTEDGPLCLYRLLLAGNFRLLHSRPVLFLTATHEELIEALRRVRAEQRANPAGTVAAAERIGSCGELAKLAVSMVKFASTRELPAIALESAKREIDWMPAEEVVQRTRTCEMGLLFGVQLGYALHQIHMSAKAPVRDRRRRRK